MSDPTKQARAPRACGQGSYLLEVVRLLWPEPAQVTQPPRLARRRLHPAADYVVLPSASHPKLLIPRRPLRVAASAVRNYRSTQSAREKITLACLAGAVRLGATSVLPGKIQVTYPPRQSSANPTDLQRHLCHVLGQRVHLSVHIGPARAVRKPVIQLLDTHGRTVAFAKLGVDAFTGTLVRNEAEAIRFLSGAALTRFRVPTVLHAGTWNGHELLVQNALNSGGFTPTASQHLVAAMNELARSRGLVRACLRASTFWGRLRSRLQVLEASDLTRQLTAAMTQIDSAHGATEVEFGCWHGDWLPWNMNIVGGHIQVWDWEKFAADVPIGFDAIHYQVQSAVVRTASTPVQAFAAVGARAQSVLAPYGVSPVAAGLLVRLYALELAVRYLEDGEMQAGSTELSQLPNWLPEVLAQPQCLEDASGPQS